MNTFKKLEEDLQLNVSRKVLENTVIEYLNRIIIHNEYKKGADVINISNLFYFFYIDIIIKYDGGSLVTLHEALNEPEVLGCLINEYCKTIKKALNKEQFQYFDECHKLFKSNNQFDEVFNKIIESKEIYEFYKDIPISFLRSIVFMGAHSITSNVIFDYFKLYKNIFMDVTKNNSDNLTDGDIELLSNYKIYDLFYSYCVLDS